MIYSKRKGNKTPSIRHHFFPQFLCRGWSGYDFEHLVSAWDLMLDKIHKPGTAPKTIGHSEHIYTAEHMSSPDGYLRFEEDFFSLVDDMCSPIIEEILSNSGIPSDKQVFLMEFISLLELRTAYIIDSMASFQTRAWTLTFLLEKKYGTRLAKVDLSDIRISAKASAIYDLIIFSQCRAAEMAQKCKIEVIYSKDGAICTNDLGTIFNIGSMVAYMPISPYYALAIIDKKATLHADLNIANLNLSYTLRSMQNGCRYVIFHTHAAACKMRETVLQHISLHTDFSKPARDHCSFLPR